MFSGCVSDKAADVKKEEPKRLVDVMVNENSDVKEEAARSIVDVSVNEYTESVNILIKGNKYLSYSAHRQDIPKGVILNFSDTTLGNIESVYTPAENEIISSIETNERVEGKTTNSTLFIALKQDTPYYDVIRQAEGLLISFPKPSGISEETILEEELTKKKLEPTIPPISTPAATRLEDVMVTSLEPNVIVNIKADGVIRDHKSFTLDNPPRIVFDIYNIKSPYKNEQIITLKSQWVNQVRHCMHPDKVRLVLDTYQGYLSNYSASPTASGLLIQVGIVPESQPE